MKVILVCIGVFREWILDNIKQLKLQGNNDIVLLMEKKNFQYINKDLDIDLIDINEYKSEYIQEFKKKLNLDTTFRDGFWYNCSLRFVYIYEYMRQNNITDIIHIENDNMIYENLDNLKDKFDKNKMYFAFDTFYPYHRAIPSIIYIPNHEIFKIILDNYDMNHNDMENLGKYINSSITEPFPIIFIENEKHFFNKNFIQFNCIFDANAIGQYLYGVDKRNDPNDTTGFINEACVIKFNNYNFYWKKDNNLWNPYIEKNNNFYKILNIHVHSKFLNKFLSDNPVENKFITKIYK